MPWPFYWSAQDPKIANYILKMYLTDMLINNFIFKFTGSNFVKQSYSRSKFKLLNTRSTHYKDILLKRIGSPLTNEEKGVMS